MVLGDDALEPADRGNEGSLPSYPSVSKGGKSWTPKATRLRWLEPGSLRFDAFWPPFGRPTSASPTGNS